ncbi:MAG: hypothetical protein ACJAYU_004213 [Bradymonadia bacterium]|jgi:hypothetical protein
MPSFDDDSESRVIVIAPEDRADLISSFEAEFQRPATDGELEEMIQGWVTQEALRREAIALGLDDNDPIIRRRLVQNMRFLLEDADPVEPVVESDVDAWIAEHLPDPERRVRVDIEHVYLSSDRRGDSLEADASQVQSELASGADPMGKGDAFVRGRQFTNVGINEMQRVFGAEFAEAVLALPPSNWSEPLESPYGLHIVRVNSRRTPETGGSETERDAARRALERERRSAVDEAAVRRIVDLYEVRRDDQ